MTELQPMKIERSLLDPTGLTLTELPPGTVFTLENNDRIWMKLNNKGQVQVGCDKDNIAVVCLDGVDAFRPDGLTASWAPNRIYNATLRLETLQ